MTGHFNRFEYLDRSFDNVANDSLRAQRYETQITVWFEADNAEDAVAIASRLEARVNEHPSAHVNCVVTRAV